MLELTTPMMLWGLLGLALPIAAHVARRRVIRVVEFPAVAWLAKSVREQVRVARWRDVVLLVLRCAVVVGLVLAFSQPVWVVGGGDDGVARGVKGGVEADVSGEVVVVVVDVSASMGWVESGLSRREVAANTAVQIIEGLRVGRDRVGVVMAGGAAEVLFAEPVWDLELAAGAVREWFDGAGEFDERADLAGAIAMGSQLVMDAGGVGRLVVVSDMQASQWDEWSDESVGGRAGGRAGDRAVEASALWRGWKTVEVVRIGWGDTDNRSVDGVAVWPTVPMLREGGGVVRLHGRVTNHHDVAVVVDVEAVLDGEVVGRQKVALEVGQSRAVGFDAVVHEVGDHRAAIAVSDDGLAIDNVASCAFHVVDRVRVLVVGDDGAVAGIGVGVEGVNVGGDVAEKVAGDVGGQVGGGGYFVGRALGSGGGGVGVDVEMWHGGEMSAARLGDVDVVVVVDSSGLVRANVARLIEYVDGGGGVIWFVDDAARWAMLDQAMGEMGGRLAWDVGELLGMSAGGAGMRIVGGAWEGSGGNVAEKNVTGESVVGKTWGDTWGDTWGKTWGKTWGGMFQFHGFDERGRQALESVIFDRYWDVRGKGEVLEGSGKVGDRAKPQAGGGAGIGIGAEGAGSVGSVGSVGGAGGAGGVGGDLLWYGDGAVAMGVMGFGRGRLGMMNFEPTRRGGGLVTRGLFVALMHAMVDHVRGSGSRGNGGWSGGDGARIDRRESEPAIWQGDWEAMLQKDGEGEASWWGEKSEVGAGGGGGVVGGGVRMERWVLWPWLFMAVLVGLGLETWLRGGGR